MKTLRTPDDRFADLPGYDFAPLTDHDAVTGYTDTGRGEHEYDQELNTASRAPST